MVHRYWYGYNKNEVKIKEKIKKAISVFIFLSLLMGLSLSPALTSSEPDCNNPGQGELDYCIGKIQSEIDALKPAHEANKQELANLKSQVSSINKKISSISNQIEKTEENIKQREEDLAFAQTIFEVKAHNHYVFLRLNDPVVPILFSDNASKAFKEIAFIQKTSNEDRKIMDEYVDELIDLKNDKDSLEKNKTSLSAAKKDLEGKVDFLGEEVAKVESYIASLSAKQQQFVAQKLGSLNLPTSLGAGPLYCTDDRNLNPGFSPAFAFYTFGIPHRVGMNQYGAYGRANSGQNHEDILRAYFENISFETKSNINITVDGYGSMPIETYLLGIYEMPGDWPLEALKAQAIAARSYAWAYTNGGASSICTSQQCQVYKGGNKGGAWEQAVQQTAGKVVSSGGQVASAWYASTAGGYLFTNSDVWGGSYRPWTKRMRDTNGDVSSFSDLQSKAYDKDSPCFYAAQGWRPEYAKSAWLKPNEVADIANVILLAKADSSTRPHLYQVDKPNPEGTDTWDHERVKQELSNRGISPLQNASSVSVTGVDFGTGKTTQVTIDGINFDGNEFRDFFNLRAPANIQIVGPLYNVERK